MIFRGFYGIAPGIIQVDLVVVINHVPEDNTGVRGKSVRKTEAHFAVPAVPGRVVDWRPPLVIQLFIKAQDQTRVSLGPGLVH